MAILGAVFNQVAIEYMCSYMHTYVHTYAFFKLIYYEISLLIG